MPVVTIELWEGRTPEQKRELVRAVSSAISRVLGCPEEAVHVILHEVPKANWGIGGRLASELSA
ncbi:MAG: 4-oxalocrotonate tautomerase DmpI [Candidatus Hadarchaeales archaeon]